MKLSCVIPVYNESRRLHLVLPVLIESECFDSIICVDDGSTDGSAEIIKQDFPQVKLIQHRQNQGKTAAIKTGLDAVKNEYVFLCDADLKKLTVDDIKLACRLLIEKKSDMIILRRINAPITTRLVRAEVLISGERILKKADLEKILREDLSGFQIEIAINQYMLDNHKSIYVSPSHGVSHPAFIKRGLSVGLTKEITMFQEIFEVITPSDWVKQYIQIR